MIYFLGSYRWIHIIADNPSKNDRFWKGSKNASKSKLIMCCQGPSSAASRHERQPLEQVHVLFVFQQCAVQLWQGVRPVAFEVFGGQVFGQEQFEPVENF